MRPEARTEEGRRDDEETAGAPPPGIRLAREVPRPGARVAGLEVVSELGRGAFGVVLRARDPALGRDVAVKLMLDRGSPEQLQRFEREGQLLASLDAPGILRVHGAGVADGRPYLVFELVEGARELDEFARPLPLAARVALVRDAARALGHAHARGIVHRDVKPANLLVDAAGRVRVADFGLALGADLERLTASGAVLGTLLYMAPEQVHGRRELVGPPTDVFALGAVLYELACGRHPFDGETHGEVMRRIALATPDAPRDVAPEISPALERVLRQALAGAPADRFPDGERLAAALDEVLAGPGVTAEPAPGRPLLLLALPLGALLVLGAAVLLHRPRDQAVQAPPRPTAARPAPAPSPAASPELQGKASAGDPRAMRELGSLLLRQRGSARAALDWLARAGRAGDAVAAREVGLLLLEGRPELPADPVGALAWLRRAAADGPDAAAMTALFDAVARLRPDELDATARAYQAHHAAGHVWPEDDPTVCGMLLAARDQAGDVALAAPYLRQRTGDPVAKLQLAELVAAGRCDEPGVAALLERLLREGALPWPERALELLDRLAFQAADVRSIGQPAFDRSERLTRARERAATGAEEERRRLLEEAAALGSSQAMFLLVRRALEEGPLTPGDLALLERSAALGYPRACEELGQLLRSGKGVARDLPRAIALLRRAVAAAGPAANATDLARLATALLEASDGRDPEGQTLLKRAAEAGDEEAVLSLAERLLDGRLPRDVMYAVSLIDGRRFDPRHEARVEAIRAALRELAHPPAPDGGPPR